MLKLTKGQILDAYENDTISLVERGDGVYCKVGSDEFFFAGKRARIQ